MPSGFGQVQLPECVGNRALPKWTDFFLRGASCPVRNQLEADSFIHCSLITDTPKKFFASKCPYLRINIIH